METRNLILSAAHDAGINFIYYSRKEDENLPLDAIEGEISKGNITVDEIVDVFRHVINRSL